MQTLLSPTTSQGLALRALLSCAVTLAACAHGGADENRKKVFRESGVVDDGGETTGDPETDPLPDTPLPDTNDPEAPVDETLPQPDAACTMGCVTCGAPNSCGGKCTVGACVAGGSCFGGVCATQPVSRISPSTYPGSWGAFVRGITWTIASDVPATIRYTIDGTTPSAASPGGPSPQSFKVDATGTAIKWYADNGLKEPQRTIIAQIKPSLSSDAGYVVENVKIDGTAPVATVAPGATLNGNMTYQAWVHAACATCRQQIVYGLSNDSKPLGCLYDDVPGTFPGKSGTANTTIKAPSAPGIYKVQVTWVFNGGGCAGAMGGAQLGVHPTTEVGTIIVK
ncbi:MAG: hypothetical protein NVS3B20_00190 [Polyangiales bacterium]